jgi:hypothetical protein
MITYTWKITDLKAKERDGLEDCVTNVGIQVTAEENGNIADFSTEMILENPNPDNFTPFNQLTEEAVIGWMKTMLEDHVQEILSIKLASASNPSPVKTTLPWA